MRFSLQELGMLDAPPQPEFDNLTRLAADMLEAPVSLVSILDFEGNRQFFKSQLGLADPWAKRRETPLSHSFCQHVVRKDEALVVDNALSHPLLQDNLAVSELGVIAYLGVPVYAPGEVPAGALCVIGGEPRTWTEAEVETMHRIAICVTDTIRLNAAMLASERLRKEQRDFTYAISHDIKSPVNTLSMLLDVIAEDRDDLSRESLECLDNAVDVVERMGRQAEDVLEYVRAVGIEDTMETVDLNALVSEVCVDLLGFFKKEEFSMEIGHLPKIQGCRMQMRSLFQNLIGNAVKFRVSGEQHRVAVDAIQSNGVCRINVRDNGIGIPPESQEKIFDLFTRLHTRKDYPGTGIGLALCRRVAENHNGFLSVSSEPGEGSVFTLRLPKVAT